MSTLVITVGTSLFTSASWRAEGPFAIIAGYDSWVESCLEEPKERQASGSRIPGAIEKELKDPRTSAADYFVADGYPELRYSAEVTTLLTWMRRERGVDLESFVNERYEQVHLVCPGDPEDSARIAANHLFQVFTNVLRIRNVKLKSVLTSGSLLDRVRHFRDYLQDLSSAEQVDLIVSGGYKVYAMFASVFAASPARRSRWRVAYLHEASKVELVVQGTARHELQFQVGDEELSVEEADTMQG